MITTHPMMSEKAPAPACKKRLARVSERAVKVKGTARKIDITPMPMTEPALNSSRKTIPVIAGGRCCENSHGARPREPVHTAHGQWTQQTRMIVTMAALRVRQDLRAVTMRREMPRILRDMIVTMEMNAIAQKPVKHMKAKRDEHHARR